jgi:hypothetical protein
LIYLRKPEGLQKRELPQEPNGQLQRLAGADGFQIELSGKENNL